MGAAWFLHGVTTAIAVNAVVIGLDTSVTLAARFGGSFDLASKVFLAIVVGEALIKMAAVWPRPRDYFANPWNMFDFALIAVSLVPSTGGPATLARLVRIFRVLRLMSVLSDLQLIVSTLVRSVPGIFNVLALMSIVFCVERGSRIPPVPRVRPHPLAHARHVAAVADPYRHFGRLDRHHVRRVRRARTALVAWAYFAGFVVVETLVILNLFVAVVLDSLDEDKHARL
ncbi:MAG: ion transporter [Bryobacterales bacterium]|nr:ion transporter [Bryobacterales bacterium]